MKQDGCDELPYGFCGLNGFCEISSEEIEEKPQFVMPSCFGRGLRLSEIEVPEIPKECLSLVNLSLISICFLYSGTS